MADNIDLEKTYEENITSFNKDSLLKEVAFLDTDSKEDNEDDFISRLYDSVDIEKINRIQKRFLKISDYKDSQKYLDYCSKAIEIYTAYDKEVKYKKAKYLIDIKSYTQAKSLLEEVNNYKDSQTLIDQINKDIELQDKLYRIKEEKEIDKMIRREKAKKVMKIVFPILEIIIFIVPIVLTIIFGNFLFNHVTQIHLDSDYDAWLTWWVIFLIFSILNALIFIIRRIRKWNEADIPVRAAVIITTILSITSSIIVFPNASKLKEEFHPFSFVSFDVTFVERYISNSKYYSKYTFTIYNTSDYDIERMDGDLTFYNNNSKLGYCDQTFSGDYKAHSHTDTTWTFHQSSTGLYNTDFEDLSIVYTMSSIRFTKDNYVVSGSNMIKYIKRSSGLINL